MKRHPPHRAIRTPFQRATRERHRAILALAHRGSTVAALLAVLLGVALLVPPVAGAAPLATYGAYSKTLTFRLTGVTPLAVTAAGPRTLTVTGSYTNTGKYPITGLGYKFQRGNPMTSAAAIRKEAADPHQQTTVIDAGFAALPGTLKAGATASFSATVPIVGSATKTLAITKPGVYPMMININATVQLPHGQLPARVGELHLMLTVLSVPGGPGSQAAASPGIPFNMLWPIVDRPHLGVDGVFTDDELATEIGPGGRLTNLVDALSASQAGPDAITLVIDPMLLDELDRMSRGYWVVAKPGTPQPALVPTKRATPSSTATASSTPTTAPSTSSPPQSSTTQQSSAQQGSAQQSSAQQSSAAQSSSQQGSTPASTAVTEPPAGSSATPAGPGDAAALPGTVDLPGQAGQVQGIGVNGAGGTIGEGAEGSGRGIDGGDAGSSGGATAAVTGSAEAGSGQASNAGSATGTGSTTGTGSATPGTTGSAPSTGTTPGSTAPGAGQTPTTGAPATQTPSTAPGSTGAGPGPRPRGTVAGKGSAAAAQFLDRLRSLADRYQVLVLPYADPDAVALVRAGMTENLATAVFRGRAVAERVLGQPALATGDDSTHLITSIADPPGGAIDGATLQDLVGLGYDAAVLSASGVSGASSSVGAVRIRAGHRDVPAVISDASLASDIGDFVYSGVPSDAASQVNLLAALMAQQHADGVTTPMVLAPGRNWSPNQRGISYITRLLELMDDQGVVTGTPLTTITASVGRHPVAALRYPGSAQQAELSTTYLSALQEIEDRIGVLQEALAPDPSPDGADPADILDPLQQALLPAVSVSLRGVPDPDSSVRDTITATLDSLYAGVHIHRSSASYTLASSTSPLLLSVQNTLPYQVSVGISILGGGRAGLITTDPGRIDIPAGPRSKPVKIETHVSRSGTFTVYAQLQGPYGATWGGTVPLTIASRAYGVLTLVLMLAAAGVMMLMVAFRWRQRWRNHKLRLAGEDAGAGVAAEDAGPGTDHAIRSDHPAENDHRTGDVVPGAVPGSAGDGAP